jgi:hypothetical protein
VLKCAEYYCSMLIVERGCQYDFHTDGFWD